MRQTELFSYLIDQEALDNYKWYQDTLEQFKVNKKVCLDTKASFKKHHKFFNSLLGDDKHCQFLVKKHIKGPLGVMGRNSDNNLIFQKLGWRPTQKLKHGLTILYNWILEEVNNKCSN